MSDVYNEFLSQKVIRRSQVIEFFSGNTEKSNAALKWLLKSGKAQRIKTGLFYFKPVNEWQTAEVIVVPWHIAANAVQGSVIGFHSALNLLGYAYSEIKDIQVVVSNELARVPKSFEYQKVRYQYTRSDVSFGVTQQVVDDVKIKTFDKERVVLEGLMDPDKFYGIAEYLQSIDDVTWLDLDHLFSLKEKYPTTSVNMRLGWLLEKYQQKWHVDDLYLKKLRKQRPEDRVFLVNKHRKGNVLDKTWNLMVPRKLMAME